MSARINAATSAFGMTDRGEDPIEVMKSVMETWRDMSDHFYAYVAGYCFSIPMLNYLAAQSINVVGALEAAIEQSDCLEEMEEMNNVSMSEFFQTIRKHAVVDVPEELGRYLLQQCTEYDVEIVFGELMAIGVKIPFDINVKDEWMSKYKVKKLEPAKTKIAFTNEYQTTTFELSGDFDITIRNGQINMQSRK